VHLVLPDQVPDRRRGDEDLHRRHPPLIVERRDQRLCDHAQQGVRDLDADLLLLMRWEDVHDTADRLGGVVRVEGRQHQVARFRGRQRLRDRLEVPHFADQDHVGVFAERAAERRRERQRVRTDLPLVDVALPVLMDELDRVLDRDDVVFAEAVHMVHHGRERGRLPRSGRARHKHQPAVFQRQLFEDRRHSKVVERLDLRRDQPQDEPLAQPLEERVDAEPPDSAEFEREIEVVGRLEPRLLVVGEDIVEHGMDILSGQERHLEPGELAVEPQRRVRPHREVEVRRAPFLGLNEEIGDIHQDPSSARDNSSIDVNPSSMRACPCSRMEAPAASPRRASAASRPPPRSQRRSLGPTSHVAVATR